MKLSFFQIGIILTMLLILIVIAFIFFSSWKKRKKTYDIELSPKKKKKLEKQRANDIKTTLDWIDIESISHQGIILHKGNKIEYVKGVAIEPININLLPEKDKQLLTRSLANALDKCKFEIYWKFVKTQPDVGMQYANINKYLQKESNINIAKIMEMQLNKLDYFRENFREMSFFAIVKSDESHINKKFDALWSALSSTFQISNMRCKDYESLVSQEFDNEIVNEYMFTQLRLSQAQKSFDDELIKKLKRKEKNEE